MSEPNEIARMENRLRDYYRGVWLAATDRPAPSDSQLLSRLSDSAARSRAPIWRLAVLRATSIVLAAVTLGPRLLQTAPAPGVPTQSPPAGTKSTPAPGPAGVDRAGLMRFGGIWAIRGSRLLTSQDNGATWAAGDFPAPTGLSIQPVVGIDVLDSRHAWFLSLSEAAANGDRSLWLYATSDGGASWGKSAAPGACVYPNAMLSFADDSNGFLACGRAGSQGPVEIYRTPDGGRSWAARGQSTFEISGMYATDSSTVWLSGFEATGPQAAMLAVSRDGGVSWQEVRLPGLDRVSQAAILSLGSPPAFVGGQGRVVIVVEEPGRMPAVHFFSTSDGGYSWTDISRAVSFYFSPIAVVAEGPRLATVVGYHLSVSDDAGQTWTEVDPKEMPKNSSFEWIAFTGPDTGVSTVFVNGQGAQLLLTADGGRTWTPASFDQTRSASPSSSPSI